MDVAGGPPGPDPAVTARREAARAGHAGDPDTARALLADPAPGVRATALAALARLGAVDPTELATALSDPEPTVRIRAAEVLAGLGTLPAGCSLLGLLADDDPGVVEVAAWACGECLPAEPGTVDALAALATTHDDALVREAAVAALGAVGDPAGLPAIVAATHDKATVRRRAVIALAPFAGPEVDEAVDRALTDRDWQVRQAAEDLRR